MEARLLKWKDSLSLDGFLLPQTTILLKTNLENASEGVISKDLRFYSCSYDA